MLMALPAPPLHVVLVPDKPTITGRVYPRAVVEMAFQQAQAMIQQRTLLVHVPQRPGAADLQNCIGIVKHAELNDRGALAVAIDFLPHARGLEQVTALGSLSTLGTGSVIDKKVADYTLEAIVVDCAVVKA